MAELLMQQLEAVVDERTTMVCLRAAGQIVPVGEPFDTLMGELDAPPFHVHCRSVVVPWMPGFVSDTRAKANAEIALRPPAEKRFGPGGYGGRLPPPPDSGGPSSGGPASPGSAPLTPFGDIPTIPDEVLRDGDVWTLNPEGDANRASYRETSPEAERLAGLVETWTDWRLPSDARKARASIESGDWDDVLAEIAKAPRNDVPLYRGVSLGDDELAALAAGDTLDLRSLASFTSDGEHARNFLFGSGDVIVEVPVGGAPAVNISGISKSPSEREWFMTGQLVVDRVDRAGDVTKVVARWR